MRVLIGASVLSAAGSLPLQILPFLVLTLVADGRVDVAFAGWVGSAFLMGLLSSAVLLPLFKVQRLTRLHALAIISAISVCLAISAEAHLLGLLLALWYAIGFGCGGLQFLGATTAAVATDKSQAFSLRLAVTLLVASAVIAATAQFDGQKSYHGLVYFLVGAFALAAGIGWLLYRGVSYESSTQKAVVAPTPASGSVLGLLVIFAFFAGQPGFWAYAMQSAARRGLDLQGAALVIALCKVISALSLLYSSKRKAQIFVHTELMGLGLAIAIGILCMTYSHAVLIFLFGFLFWELALNVLSARLQAMVVTASPRYAGIWLTGAIFLGAATGPIVHGATIGIGIEPAFIAYAALSGLFPFFWAYSRTERIKR